MVMRWEVLVLMVVILAQVAQADKIELKSGKSVEGRIVRQDDKAVVVDTGLGTPLTYYRDEIDQVITAPFADPSSEADKLENEAVELIDSGKRREGLLKMVKAIELDPTPLRQMNYGSVLFGDGVEAYKKGNLKNALNILHVCERQLKAAIEAFNPSSDGVYLSQCYFLLGEMNANAFQDADQARTYYKKALSFFEHPAAKAALEKMGEGI